LAISTDRDFSIPPQVFHQGSSDTASLTCVDDTPAAPHIVNALTIDVEDYFQVTGFERDIDRDEWDSIPSRVYDSTCRLLEILSRKNVTATFFVLGWIADRFPRLVREIDAAGHEIGSHSFWHRLVYSQTPIEFRDDLRRSKEALEQLVGRPITAYRAPSFSITGKSLWALEILVEEGFLNDSSIFPVHHDRYGIPGARREPYVIETEAGDLMEFPPSVRPIGPINLPISGGGYFRLLPYSVTQRSLARINTVQRKPFMFYLHPWEIDPLQPRLDAGTPASRFRHRVNLKSTEAKLQRLLGSFAWGTLTQSLKALSVDGNLDSGSSTRYRKSEPNLKRTKVSELSGI
jgi:polysaccharide deacetylase family protein (PEP-CTERM system associated)